MGVEQGPEYYDHIADSQPLESHPRRDLYITAAGFLAPGAGPVADLGCGSGLLAQALAERGLNGYWGVDFSPASIKLAQQRVPNLTFETKDLYDPVVRACFQEFKHFFLLEVLEHVDQDLELLAALPAGAQVVASLPSFDDPGHVRIFPDVAAIRSRYGKLLDIMEGRTLGSSQGDKIFLFNSRKL